MKSKNEDPSTIGQLYFYGDSVKRNYRKAFPYLLEAAERGDVHCCNLVGYCLNLGLGVEQDHEQALQWYKKVAKYDHPEALFNLALIYENVKPKGKSHYIL